MANLSTSRVVRPDELAERLGVSRVTLWRWERAGQLPAKRRIGPNVVGWLESEIDEWFALTDGEAGDEQPDLTAEVEAVGVARR
jgi:predicted DNA-binding transcriptional regulator AlpA